jgi:polyketide biosynthesis 3-hydroxy-3-methylglutaryl-CoA synthase-like enzyme PksG
LLVTCSESGIDFGKSMSTYLHHYLGLDRNCRLFEVKQACYSGTAGMQIAAQFVLSRTSPGALALVVCTDLSHLVLPEGGAAISGEWAFAEPIAGAGGVAMLIGERPELFELDIGANGYYGYEVMDTCRPDVDLEAGDADLSLLSYLDCCEQSFLEYQRRVQGADYRSSFQYLSFHTPFGGMVKGAHRTMMRKLGGAAPAEIEADFHRRLAPSLAYCQRVGNIMGGTLFLALAGTIDTGDFPTPKRIGCFSYGSGCCAEFFSGVTTSDGQSRLRELRILEQLDRRYELSMEEYDHLLSGSAMVRFGTRSTKVDLSQYAAAMTGRENEGLLQLTGVRDFHREYRWLS